MQGSRLVSRLASLAYAVAALALLVSCKDVVYRDRPPFNPPPDLTNGYLGYYDAAQHQTTCGNCHVGQQADWAQTLHASAWDTVKASANFNQSCVACHTVNTRGNRPLARAGYDTLPVEGYHDVQCESCHGPGYTHVQNPSIKANRPLASITVWPPEAPNAAPATAADTAKIVNSSCGACHQAAGPSRNHNFLKEWKSSRHGSLRAGAAPSYSPAGNATCQPCHEAKGALAAWGITSSYKELGTNTLLPQNCVVCHDPHGSAKGADGKPLKGQVRFPIDQAIVEVNLCTKCHNRISAAAPDASRGPHGAQGPVLFGTAGYFPPGSSYDTTAILTSHGSTLNPRLCAGCHVNRLTGVDAGGNQISYVGHSFHPLPCYMAGRPGVVDTTFSNSCAYTSQARSWQACTNSGCHASADIAVQRLQQISNERNGYIHTLWVDVNHNQTVDAYPTDSGYLARIKAQNPNDLNFTTAPYNTILTPAKGALFNAQLTGEDLSGHPDGSHGVHNPFLYRALLQSSIADLLKNYPYLSSPAPNVLTQIQNSIRSGELRVAPETQRIVMQLRKY